MGLDKIIVHGAKEHNLKNIHVEIPRDQFVVITGLSGSGKSSLAFDTIYAEGQRRYVESLSAYARQFLGQMEKPNVEYIEGLSPAISIDQKTTSKNPRSTVGTVTEIYDYLRLLYANIGIPHCPKCGTEITQQTVDQMVDRIMQLPERTKIQLLAPVVRGKKGEHKKILEQAHKEGYVRVRVDGDVLELTDEIILEKNKKHTVEIVVDRLVIKEGIEKRLTDSIETVLKQTGGTLVVNIIDEEDITFSQSYACPNHPEMNIPELSPRMFSFNSPFGACTTCTGLGTLLKMDPDIIIPNKELSILEGAINASGWNNIEQEDSGARSMMEALAKHYAFSLNSPIKDLPPKAVEVILYGTKGEKIQVEYSNANGRGTYMYPFEGIIPNLQRRYKDTASEGIREELEAYMSNNACPDCNGYRLNPIILAVTVRDKNIAQVCEMPIDEIDRFFTELNLSEQQYQIAEQILKEIHARLGFLLNVGLEYLTLSRSAGTLSGGESQRIRLATQIGSGLMGVLYILDEPSIGLHQRDNDRLLDTLKHLRDVGNTLLVVEHDEDTMFVADHIIDIGPGAGVHGGEVVFSGKLKDLLQCETSETGLYLSGKKKIEVPKQRRKGNGQVLEIVGANENNLQNVNIQFPLGNFICVTGVSGSGKSTLINEILYKRLAKDLNRAKIKPGMHKELLGLEHVDKVIDIDQSPIGRTPRSNPATYTGVFDAIRDLFAETNEAKIRGYQKGRFSFNVKGGRCEACRGDGIIKIEMHFLPDVYVPCEICGGKRYNRETLEVRYKGKNIYEILEMTIEEALIFFENIPRIKTKIQALYDVGLGYVKLGQPSTQLSGGEAQRVKLATELSKRSTGKTVYILDEPTTGLHFADVHRLVDILQRLADAGNTLIVIEHNLDVIKTADYIIDLGPEGGNKGGMIVAAGTPEEVAQVKQSYTGQYIQKMLQKQL